jgi:hypothetical protein
MANTPQGAYSPSDDDLDELVGTTEDDEGEASDDAPERTAGASSGEEPGDNHQDAGAPGNAADGADEQGQHDEDGADEREPGAGEGSEADEAAPVPGAAPLSAIPPGSKPFAYRGAGAEHQLPGAHELPDGAVLIGKDATPTLRQLLASEAGLRQDFTRFRRESQRQIEDLKTRRVAREEEAEAVYQLFADLKKMTPEERWDFFTGFEQEAPKLELAVERRKIEQERKELEQARQGPRLTEDEQQEAQQKVLTNELNVTFRTLAQHEDAKLFTPEELTALYAKWAKRPQRLARTLTADEGEYRSGTTVFDDGEVWEDFQLLAGIKKRQVAANGAEARNRALNADRRPANVIPPTPTPNRAGGEGRKRTPNYSNNRKGFKNDFLSGKLDDPD